MDKKPMDIKTLVYMALLIALSYIGSFMKIFQSIAIDALPGYFAAFFLGPLAGGIVAGAGHILTAINSGFPSTLPIHIITMFGMGLGAYLVGYTYEKTSNGILACVVGVIFNGPVLLAVLWPITNLLAMPLSGKAFFLMLIGPLLIASTLNVVLGYLVYKLLEKKL